MPRKLPCADSAPSDLVVARGHVQGREILVVGFHHAPALAFHALTPAERSIVVALLAGASNAAIAAARGTSARTVDKQVAVLLRKLGVRTRAELATLAAGRAPPRADVRRND